jgi:hypothetical protein
MDEYITLSQAARRLPQRTHTAAVWRWCRRGILTRNGQRIYLDHVRLGGRIYVTPQAITTFGQQLALGDREHFRSPAANTRSIGRARSAQPADRRIDRASQNLKAEGI